MKSQTLRSAMFLLTFLSFSLANSQSRSNELYNILNDPTSDYVMVVAHRGDWRNAPENSLQAIQNCIDMGVDMIEIDIRKTKDGVLILMHDETVDRTTNGSGKVSEMTWDELKKLQLTNGIGSWTDHKIPTLEDALDLTRNKILVNLDKGYEIFNDTYDLVSRKRQLNEVVFKGRMKSYEIAKEEIMLDSIMFMPIIALEEKGWKNVVQSYASNNYRPVAYEVIFKTEGQEEKALELIRDQGSKLWVNSLWDFLNAGHHDDRAVYDTRGSYGWLIEKGTTLIQTDRPGLLLEFLEVNNYR